MRETNKKGQSSFGESIRLLQTGHLPTLSGHGTLPTAGEVYQSQRLIQRFIFFIAGSVFGRWCGLWSVEIPRGIL